MKNLDVWSAVAGRRALVTGLLVLCAGLLPVAEGQTNSREALGRLKAGNDRFVKNASAPVSLSLPTREALAKGQTPYAMVLSCADSRVPPEYIFNAGLGELFVIRAAGEVVDRSVMASLEYGAEHLKIPLLIVLGHESCGAVKAVVDNATVHGPNLQYLVNAIRAGTSRTHAEKRELRGAILANVEQVINDAMSGSEILRHAARVGALQIVGGYYELASGRVVFSEPANAATAAEPHK
jgi:carbonic anhydrase